MPVKSMRLARDEVRVVSSVLAFPIQVLCEHSLLYWTLPDGSLLAHNIVLSKCFKYGTKHLDQLHN